MPKLILIISLLLGYSLKSFSQLPSASVILNNYTNAQKRLLIISTVEFINLITQFNIDQDSVRVIACRITNLPLLLAYSEGAAYKPQPGADLINEGRPAEAAKKANTLQGNEKIQLLVQLATWYIYQPQAYKKDLDSAGQYLAFATRLSAASTEYKFWQNECRFLKTILNHQAGHVTRAITDLQQLLVDATQGADQALMAKVNLQLAKWLPDSDSTKSTHLDASLELYRGLQMKEGEIELLLYMGLYDFNFDLKKAKEKFDRVLGLEQTTGFRHTLYIKNMLAFMSHVTADHVTAMQLAVEALDNVKWSGFTILEPSFLYRIANVYSLTGNKEEVMAYCRKALENPTTESQIFWFTSANELALVLAFHNRAAEGISLLKNIFRKYPPVLPWHKMQIASSLGACYVQAGNFEMADQSFMSLLEIEDKFPSADPHGQVLLDHFDIADFYIANNKLKKARLFLDRVLTRVPVSKSRAAMNLYSMHRSLYKIDSLEEDYKSALRNFFLHKMYYDSANNISHREKVEELTIKYETETKDKDITNLKQQALVDQAQLKQNRLTKKLTLAGIVLLLIFTALLYNQYRIKQSANKLISKKNDALNKLVVEKEWLLKEIHHRVKNNLQTVVSLLELQPDFQQQAFSAIRDSRNRVYAMSLIHQKLYQSENIASVNMRVYLVELVTHLQDIYNIESKIRIVTRFSPVELDVSQAIPVGLIVNEAVTNCIKHAFTNTSHSPEIMVSLENTLDGMITLVIADNGIGLPADVEKTKSKGFGFRLMKGLVEDIDGKFVVKSDTGTQIEVFFGANIPFHEIDNQKVTENAALA